MFDVLALDKLATVKAITQETKTKYEKLSFEI
jgi:hypothetical protein